MPKPNKYSSAVKPTRLHQPFDCCMEKNVRFGKEFDGSKGTTSTTER